YSVRKKDSDDDDFDISSYICNCCDFQSRQLPCKHVLAILSQSHLNDESIDDNQLLLVDVESSYSNSNISCNLSTDKR
ncbi:34514_t:CDS:1, partial [Racocetra persica]